MPIRFSTRLAVRNAKAALKSEEESSDKKKYPGEGTLYARKKQQVVELLGGKCEICNDVHPSLYIVMEDKSFQKKEKVPYLLRKGTAAKYEAHLECPSCFYRR